MKHVLLPKTAVREYNHVLDFPKIGKFYDLYEKQTNNQAWNGNKKNINNSKGSVSCLLGNQKDAKAYFSCFQYSCF